MQFRLKSEASVVYQNGGGGVRIKNRKMGILRSKIDFREKKNFRPILVIFGVLWPNWATYGKILKNAPNKSIFCSIFTIKPDTRFEV